MATEIKQINSCGNKNKCSSCLKIIGVVGFIGNIFLVLLKVTIGIAFFSTALLADALYSLLDIGFSILIIVGLKISSQPPDSKHDFGHGKIEFVVTVAFSVLTILGAICLFIFALFELHEGAMGTFSGFVLLAALVSTLANYLFYRFTDCIATQFYSPSIRSLSIHSKADATSSVLVVISMIFAYWGYHHVGPIVAIIETAHILIIGSELFKGAMYGLLDASISPEEIKDVKSSLNSIPGISNTNYVKSRKVGQRVWLNIEIEIPASFNISRVDAIKNDINETIRGKVKNIQEIMVNVVPFREEEQQNELSLAGSQ